MADNFWDPAGDEPVTASKLQNGSFFGADDVTDLKTVDTSDLADGSKYLESEMLNAYQFSSGSSELSDEYLVVEPTTGGGRHVIGPDSGESCFPALCPSIPESLPAVQATLDFSSISAGAIGTSTVTVDGAAAGDLVVLGPPAAIEAGLVWCGFVSADDTVTIRMHNTTGSPIDPASASWSVQVTKPNSLPSINQYSLVLYELLLAEYYDSTTLETELGNSRSEVAFALLCARTTERRVLLANSTIKTAIQGSTIANAIMEGYEGAGY